MLFVVFLVFVLVFSAGFAFGETVPEEAVSGKPMKFVPDIVTVQYAGNMGLASVGLGYQSKSERSSIHFFYGYLPKS